MVISLLHCSCCSGFGLPLCEVFGSLPSTLQLRQICRAAASRERANIYRWCLLYDCFKVSALKILSQGKILEKLVKTVVFRDYMQSRVTVPLMAEQSITSIAQTHLRREAKRPGIFCFGSVTRHKESAPSCGPSVPLEVWVLQHPKASHATVVLYLARVMPYLEYRVQFWCLSLFKRVEKLEKGQ